MHSLTNHSKRETLLLYSSAQFKISSVTPPLEYAAMSEICKWKQRKMMNKYTCCYQHCKTMLEPGCFLYNPCHSFLDTFSHPPRAWAGSSGGRACPAPKPDAMYLATPVSTSCMVSGTSLASSLSSLCFSLMIVPVAVFGDADESWVGCWAVGCCSLESSGDRWASEVLDSWRKGLLWMWRPLGCGWAGCQVCAGVSCGSTAVSVACVSSWSCPSFCDPGGMICLTSCAAKTEIQLGLRI